MYIDIKLDLMNFGMALIIGFLMGALFDIYRAIRWNTSPRKTVGYLEDIVFWIVIAIVFFMLLVRTTDGVLRGFVFIASFIGAIIYFLILSRRILPIFVHIFKLIFKLINEIIKLFLYPFRGMRKRIRAVKLYFKEMGKYFKIILKKK